VDAYGIVTTLLVDARQPGYVDSLTELPWLGLSTGAALGDVEIMLRTPDRWSEIAQALVVVLYDPTRAIIEATVLDCRLAGDGRTSGNADAIVRPNASSVVVIRP